jgi:hypothetical protein
MASPANLGSKKEYRGINHLIITVVSMSEGFSSPNWWATFWQIKAAGRDLWRFMPHFSAGALCAAPAVTVSRLNPAPIASGSAAT